MAIMMEVGRWPKIAATLTASSSCGTDSRMSTRRMTTLSTQPPNAPASTPSSSPPSSPPMVATTPMTSDWRAPYRSLDSSSAPEAVEAQRVALAGAGDEAGSDLGPPDEVTGGVRRQHRREQRDEDEHGDDDEPQDRHRVGAQPAPGRGPQRPATGTLRRPRSGPAQSGGRAGWTAQRGHWRGGGGGVGPLGPASARSRHTHPRVDEAVGHVHQQVDQGEDERDEQDEALQDRDSRGW